MNDQLFLALMDPAGAPAHPLVFLVLSVVTFALHIAAVALLLGSLALAIRCAFSKSGPSFRLARPMAFTAKVSVAIALVLGVAPLLFVQVVYDPFWYTSSMLSAWWTLGFLGFLLLGYLAIYRFWMGNHCYEDVCARGFCKSPVSLVVAFVAFLGCAWIMHSLSNQLLFPKQFMEWYAPNGTIDPSGRTIHYTLYPRMLFFMALAFPVTSAWITAMRGYLLTANEQDYDYIDYLESLALKLSSIGGPLLLILGVWWMQSLPESMVWFLSTPWPYIGLLPLAFFLIQPIMQKKRRLCLFCAYAGFGMTLLMVIVLAALRELLRYGTLAREAGWEALAYKVSFDGYSTILFFATFLIVGGATLVYMLSLAWRAGKTKEVVEAPARVEKLGNYAIGLLAIWIVAYFVVGIVTMATA